MKVYLVEIEHYDEYIAGPLCAFSNEQDAMRFIEEWDSAHEEGHAFFCEYEMYRSFDVAMSDGYADEFDEIREA